MGCLAFALSFIFVCQPLVAQTKKTATKFLYPQLEGPERTPAIRTFDAQHYLLRTRFERRTKTVWGDETVTLKPLKAKFNELDLDAAGLLIDDITLVESGEKLTWRQEKPDQLIIKLNSFYSPAETLNIRLRYHVVSPKHGLYFTPEATLNLSNTKLRRPPQIWTQGEPEDNRFWFAGHDFPNDFATTEQYITTTAPGETAIANGRLMETVKNPDGTSTFHWRMEQPHALYLVSLIVGEFVKLEDVAVLPAAIYGAERAVPLEYYTYAGAETASRTAYGRTPEMMRVFSRLTGFPFPFAKYAQTGVAFYDQFEGMENITATTLSDTAILRPMLFRAANADLANFERRNIDNLVSHELAHSWFGDTVTCQDWSHLWLNEGMATYMEAIWQESLDGSKGYLREMLSNQDQYFNEDSYRYRRPLIYRRYKNSVELFDLTTYKKGAFVIHMLRRQVGDEPFWQAINRYLSQHAHQNVTTPDLQHAFELASGQKLDWFFQQWVYQAGFPELRVRYRYSPDKKELELTVQQTQKPDAATPAIFRLPGTQIEITLPGNKVITETININERAQVFTLPLEEAPLRVYFDADERILKKLDYPQQPGVTATNR